MDDLQQIAQENLAAREREIAVCRGLIAERVATLMEWFEQNQAALHQRYPNGIFVPSPRQA
jgi:glutamyl-tRNA reductase